MATASATTTSTPAGKRRRGWRELPVIRQLHQSVGLQRGMLVAGLVLSSVFLLTAVLCGMSAVLGLAAEAGAGDA